MEQPGVGSGSAASHSESTQSFFFHGLFKIRPKVCRGACRAVSHAASYVSLPDATESDEQRRGKSKEQAVTAQDKLPGPCLLHQHGTLWGHLCLLPPSPPRAWQGPRSPRTGGRAWPLREQLCNGHLLSSGAWWAEGAPLVPSACPPAVITSDSWLSFAGGKRPLSFAFSLQNVWEWSPGTDKTETRLWVSQREGRL